MIAGQPKLASTTWYATLAVVAASSLALYYIVDRRTDDEKQKNSSIRGVDDNNLHNSRGIPIPDVTEDEDTNGIPPMREIQLPAQGSGMKNSSEMEVEENPKNRILTRNSITIVHGSVTGTCARFAQQLYDTIHQQHQLHSQSTRLHQTTTITNQCRPNIVLQMGTTEDWDWWDELLNDENTTSSHDIPSVGSFLNSGTTGSAPALLVLLLPTYTNGGWPPVAEGLLQALQDLQNDWRIAKFPLKGKLQVAVFGMGSSEYTDHITGKSNMGQPAREAIRYFQKLGAKSVQRLTVGDDAVGNHAKETFQIWQDKIIARYIPIPSNTKQNDNVKNCGCKSNSQHNDASASKEQKLSCCQSSPDPAIQQPVDDHHIVDSEDEEQDDENEHDENNERETAIVDLEDLGNIVQAQSRTSDPNGELPEMVTPSQAKALKKEGYRLIGSHSAVKLCRWTKHQLRGRGGCYKHTFYGITSYQCMEATPSLACANKCVFCWRHHKNPVSKNWKWKTDDPHFIVDEAVKAHIRMINETKGIPGVQMDRWEEAHTVRHCALSLVGEPIMYPRIDELIGDLHSRHISTFLVTNGQHPEAIGKLRPITQLYVSVDAPNRDDLIAIDRPLFNDAWDRLKQSLTCLKAKGQRTVARLTVVKGWNSDDVEGYAKLIALGHVSLVEVKGVTFCGKSDASNLNMSNTPFHHEVLALTQTLKAELDKLRTQVAYKGLPEYGLACEHKHSVSVLLARVDQFAVDDPITGKRKWRTWIDYDKFNKLAAKNDRDPTFVFSVEDYTVDTPSWALLGADEEGFDPTDSRFHRKQKYPKYTHFDEMGIPTHDHNHEVLSEEERLKLKKLMNDKLNEIGSGSTVTELKGGAKHVLDASLMFRGLVVTR